MIGSGRRGRSLGRKIVDIRRVRAMINGRVMMDEAVYVKKARGIVRR